MIRVPVAKPPEASRRRATIVTLTFLALGIGAAPQESLRLATSLAGVAAVIAIGAGFGPRGTLSLTPWIFTTVGVVSYAGALLAVDQVGSTMLLNLIGLGAVAGAASAAFTQRSMASISERVEIQQPRHLHRPRWGAAFVAGGVALALLSLRTADFLDRSDSLTGTPRAGAAGGSIAPAPYLLPEVVARVEDPSIVESSGLVAARSSADAFWTHNDSGDGPWLYCLRAKGTSCGRWRVIGAAAVDWEAIAATGSGGSGTLYIGDIGDNDSVRSHVTVYEVAEPKISDRGEGGLKETAPARQIELRYPNGPLDAEAMLVHPTTGDLYVMAKGEGSNASVFKAAHPFGRHVALEHVGSTTLFGLLVDRTGLDVAPDGQRVAVATYGGIYELVREPGEPFDAIWDNEPTLVDDGVDAQVEAVAYASDGFAIFFTEERERPRLWRIKRVS